MFGGVPFCRACYDHDFERRPCIRCGEPARLHRSQDSGLCRSCEIEQRECVRCQQPVPRAALTLAEGVVCKKCRRFYPPFRRPEPRPDFVTCSGCHRHRRPAIWTLSRKPLCIKCVDEDYVEVARTEQENYWIASALSRWRDAATDMPSDWHRVLATEFGSYLIVEIGPNKAALQVKSQIAHVRDLAARVPGTSKPTREQLLTAYTAGDIRKADLFFRFLRSIDVEVPSREHLTQATERKRTQETLKKLAGNPLEAEVRCYHDRLTAKLNATAKSIRLYIFAAVSFALSCKGKPTDASLTRYLRKAPGQRNSLYGFVLELARAGHDLQPPAKTGGKARASKATDIERAVQTARETESYSELKSLVASILTSTTGIPLETITRLPVEAMAQLEAGKVGFSLLGMSDTLGEPLAPVLVRYLNWRDAEEMTSPHLFPGRPTTEPIVAVTVAHHLKKLDLSILRMAIAARKSNKRAARKKQHVATRWVGANRTRKSITA